MSTSSTSNDHSQVFTIHLNTFLYAVQTLLYHFNRQQHIYLSSQRSVFRAGTILLPQCILPRSAALKRQLSAPSGTELSSSPVGPCGLKVSKMCHSLEPAPPASMIVSTPLAIIQCLRILDETRRGAVYCDSIA